MVKIPKLWLDGLDLNPSFMESLLSKDKEIMYNFGIASKAIKMGKYRNDPTKQRLKLEATKNEFIDCFLYKYLFRKNTIIKIKNKLIMEYDFKRTKINEYDLIMKELDNLLGINEIELEKCTVLGNSKLDKCNCSNKGFGFCFCINDSGIFYN